MRDRIVELVRVKSRELKEHPGNWRTHPKHQRDALAGMLDQIGYADALLARRDGKDLVLIDGHLRRSLDPDQVVPVLVLDVDEAEADALLATIDPLAGLAGANAAALKSLLGPLESKDPAVRELLDGLWRRAELGLERIRSQEQVAPKSKARTKPDDLWRLGPHRLLCGDATESLSRLMKDDRAALVVTDPPWGANYQGKTPGRLEIANDDPCLVPDLLARAFARSSKPRSRALRCMCSPPRDPCWLSSCGPSASDSTSNRPSCG